MDREKALGAIAPILSESGCFLVGMVITKDNDITITIEKEHGEVDLDDCVRINDVFVQTFDRDVEDYSLTVTSAGLDQPFKVEGQYLKAIGSAVDVLFKGGRKLTGILTAADGNGISLRYSQKEKSEGSKRKVTVEHEDSFPFTEINAVMPHVEFK
ncbi:MAG: ribosome assembly cofactor RimP [Candidatus Cryptobacteroides sp.]